jgi:hypothetical protein
MKEIEEEIKELHERTERTRVQFLKAEIRTCFTAAEFGELELSAGNADMAERERAFVEEGVRTIERFLSQVSAGQRSGLDASLAELKAALDSFQARLMKAKPRGASSPALPT